MGFLVAVLTGFSFLSLNNDKTYSLNGKWSPIRQEMGGKILPSDFFRNQKMILNDTSYTVIAESVDKGIINYGLGKMDIYGKEGVNAGKHITAIYRIEGRHLIICYNLKGITYPDSFNTAESTFLFLSDFEKVSD